MVPVGAGTRVDDVEFGPAARAAQQRVPQVRAGQRVFVPHYYAGRGHYFISKRSLMMIKVLSWDHEGTLYEAYEYPELELNAGFEDRDFDYRNPDYDFVIVNQR